MRARPYTHEIHKGLFDINGRPNMERIITIMRDELKIKEIVIVVGYLGDSIKQHFGDGSHYGVAITYIDNTDLERGWAWSVLLAEPHIDRHFCVMLCDECYISSNHCELLRFPYTEHLAVCAGMHVDDALLIKKNYAIEKQQQNITALIEKPQSVSNDLMGSGTFVFSPQLFAILKQAFADSKTVDLVSLLNEQISQQQSVAFFELAGTYVNINDRDSLQLAKYHDRINQFSSYTSSLLIFSEGNEQQVAFTVDRYRELKQFEQIALLLPHNHSIDTQQLDVECIVCPPEVTQFGERLHYGLARLTGDIFVMTEADYSFPGRDVEKLLSYLKEADMVVGTRTTRQLIEQGSTMRGVVRAAHTALGMLLELLWWKREGRFTDVGCTFRALWKTTYEELDPSLTSKGPEFLAEMVIASLNKRQRVLEIPVNYFNRSQSQNRSYRNVATFMRVLLFIMKTRCRQIFKKR